MDRLNDLRAWIWSDSPAEFDVRGIIVWWELRRLIYNVFIGCLGSVCFPVFFFCIIQSGHLGPGEDAVEPLALLFAPVAANVFYSAGWVAEVLIRGLRRETRPLGPTFLALGMLFSLLVIATPAVFWLNRWLFGR